MPSDEVLQLLDVPIITLSQFHLRLIKAWVKNDSPPVPPQQGSRNLRGLRE